MLLKKSGLGIKIEGNKLVFGEKMVFSGPNLRTIEQMRPVLLSKNAKSKKELYCMYRGVCKAEHEKKILQNNLRYDITVIPPAKIGPEFVKTLGHYHPFVPGTRTCFPEVYEVVLGTAHFILQNENDCALIKATSGQKVIMPPGYGHVTINPSKKTLVLSNWVEKNFQSIYGPIKEKGGAMYFETTNGLQKNPNYGVVPELRRLAPVDFKEFGLVKNRPMYSLVGEIEKLDFLKNPQNYLKQFERFLRHSSPSLSGIKVTKANKVKN